MESRNGTNVRIVKRMETRKYSDKDKMAAHSTGMYRKGLHLEEADNQFTSKSSKRICLLVVLRVKLFV